MSPDAVRTLVHRVNNLLATIEIQAEMARTLDTHAAYRQAVETMRQSATKTAIELKALRSQLERDDRQASP